MDQSWSEVILRWQRIVSGEDEPITPAENLLLFFYQSAIVDIPLMQCLIEAGDENDSDIELQACLIGYALGQMASLENEDDSQPYH